MSIHVLLVGAAAGLGYVGIRVLTGLATTDVKGWLPHVNRAVIERAVDLLPPAYRERYVEEWIAETAALEDRPLTASIHVIWLLLKTPATAAALRGDARAVDTYVALIRSRLSSIGPITILLTITCIAAFSLNPLQWMLVNLHSPITIGAIIFLYLRHNRSFYFVRNMFLLAIAGALALVLVVPQLGTVHSSSTALSVFISRDASAAFTVTVALLVGWPLSRLTRLPVTRALWFVYPFLVTYPLVSSPASIFNVLLGAALAASAAYGASSLARSRHAQ
jgi:hypothetical protein